MKITSALLFAVMSVLVRYVGERYPVGQIVFFRSAFAILPVVVIYAWRGELQAAVVPEDRGEVARRGDGGKRQGGQGRPVHGVSIAA